MSLDTAPSTLPVFVLLNDIIFPGSQVTISVPRSYAPFLSRIVKHEEMQPPVVAAVPVLNPSPNLLLQDANLCEWGCAARITRFVRPTPLSPNVCIVTLAGVTRIRLEAPHPPSSKLHSLPPHPQKRLDRLPFDSWTTLTRRREEKGAKLEVLAWNGRD
ncbi:hypothetical protein FS842_006739 [Serendipita sp. 407]|nr:hypothetical protein FS842_006739 [Serendipita sp. 407]